jgi:uncharacterized protein YbjT (DUF2867 family)
VTHLANQRVLLLGATGLVGGHALRQALDDPRVARVVAPTRRALPAPGNPKLEVVKLENPVVDFDALPDDAAWWAVDGVICALGTTIRQAGSKAAFRRVDVDYAVDTARRARAAGARRFALNSSAGANAASRIFYLRCKGEAEAAVQALGYGSVTIVRPSLIGGERAAPRPSERRTARLLDALGGLVPARYRVVPAERIAACLLEAALAAPPGVRFVESDAI